jgi:hypothetical protein
MNNDDLTVVLIDEEDKVIIQCIEYDISVQGNDFEDAANRFYLTVQAEQAEVGGLYRIGPAPDSFNQAYRNHPNYSGWGKASRDGEIYLARHGEHTYVKRK